MSQDVISREDAVVRAMAHVARDWPQPVVLHSVERRRAMSSIPDEVLAAYQATRKREPDSGAVMSLSREELDLYEDGYVWRIELRTEVPEDDVLLECRRKRLEDIANDPDRTDAEKAEWIAAFKEPSTIIVSHLVHVDCTTGCVTHYVRLVS